MFVAMVQSKATSVSQYLKELPEDRRAAISAIRKVMRGSIDPGFEETMSYGMISYQVPLRIYPSGYHCTPGAPLPYASLASQKNHMAIYMMGLYMDPDDTAWFVDAWKATGKKLDMGKSCIRFKKLEDVALDVVAEALRRMPSKRYIATYEGLYLSSRKGPAKKSATKKSAAAMAPAKKAAKK
ncbi:MAG: hypothetical protein ACI89X_002867 [Planctomycetota bacterium]|jgi:hypothetical protein